MADKYLYIIDHYIPFPASEYGGVWNVIAEDDEECFDLITQEDDGLNEKHYHQLRENINKAPAYLLAEDVKSEIIEQFTT